MVNTASKKNHMSSNFLIESDDDIYSAVYIPIHFMATPLIRT